MTDLRLHWESDGSCQWANIYCSAIVVGRSEGVWVWVAFGRSGKSDNAYDARLAAEEAVFGYVSALAGALGMRLTPLVD